MSQLRNNSLVFVFLLVVFTLLVYRGALDNLFVWDDLFVVEYNEFIRTWENFPQIFTKDYLTSPNEFGSANVRNIGAGETSYRPVVTATYFLDYAIWKLKPFGYHLHSLLLHILNVILFFFFVLKIIKKKSVAFSASLLFAVHPVNAEAVVGIAFREELLVFLFCVGSFLLYLQAQEVCGKTKVLCSLMSLGMFFLGLFSKEMAVTLPALIVFYDVLFVFDGNIKEALRRRKTSYLGYIGVLAFYLFIRFSVLVISAEPRGFLMGGSFLTHFLSMIKIVAGYIYWLIVPVGIHVVLPEDRSFLAHGLGDVGAILALLCVLACLWVAIKSRKNNKEITYGIVWFFIALGPVANIIPLQNFMASRYLYLPVAGFCLVLAVLFFRILNRAIEKMKAQWIKQAGKYVFGALLLFYSVMTIQQVFSYRNDLIFLQELARYYPRVPRVRVALGESYKDRGSINKALNEYAIALYLDPKYAKTYVSLGNYYYNKQDYIRALKVYHRAVDLREGMWTAYAGLGKTCLVLKMYPQAVKYLQETLKRAPNYVRALNNLGVAFYQMGDELQAEEMWKKALRVNPGYLRAVRNLQSLKSQKKKLKE